MNENDKNTIAAIFIKLMALKKGSCEIYDAANTKNEKLIRSFVRAVASNDFSIFKIANRTATETKLMAALAKFFLSFNLEYKKTKIKVAKKIGYDFKAASPIETKAHTNKNGKVAIFIVSGTQ
ncbi:hypothetical protein D3C85_1217760 [compost metagenome]